MTTPNAPWLHLGSGDHYAEGWCNVDMREDVRVDYHEDAFDLPFAEGSFTKVYLGHFLEHLPLDMLFPLGVILRKLAPNADIAIVGPCITKGVNLKVSGWLLDAIIAHGEGYGAHQWTSSTEVTSWFLRNVMDIEHEEVPVNTVHLPEWPNPAPQEMWQFAFIGKVAS